MQPKNFFFSLMCVLEQMDKGQSLLLFLWSCAVSLKAESLCKDGTASSVSCEYKSVFFSVVFYVSVLFNKIASVQFVMRFRYIIISQ